MEHLRDLNDLHLQGCALTVGSFDGVHRGHQALIRRTVEDSLKSGLPAVVLTFHPHPSVVLGRREAVFYISSPDEKAELLGALGVDFVVTQRFDRELSRVRASDFLDRLQAQIGLKSLWMGEDFALGHKREGNRFFLEKAGAERGFRVNVIPPVVIGGEVVGSTRVREALRGGDVARVATYLGRPFNIQGTVVRGAGRGKGLGIPTANLSVWEERACPAAGVYACFVEMEGREYKAVTNVGVRPTFESGNVAPVIEAHILDYSKELYGESLNLEFIERLRDERRFPTPQALLSQIRDDIARTRELLDGRSEVGHA